MKNPSSGSRIVTRGRTDGRTDGRTETEVTKLILAFRNFANAPKNIRVYTNGNRTQKKNCADPQFRRTGFERVSHLTGQIFGPGISASTGPDRQRPKKSANTPLKKLFPFTLIKICWQHCFSKRIILYMLMNGTYSLLGEKAKSCFSRRLVSVFSDQTPSAKYLSSMYSELLACVKV
jgi:hypothetical protein